MYSYPKGIKTCRTCKKTKDYRSYHKAVGNADGYENQCKPCKALKLDPDHRNTYIKQWRAKRVEAGVYGLCKTCQKPLGRNEGNSGRNSNGYCIKCNHGDVHQSYKGGHLNGDGYRIVYVGPRKTMLQHRHIMEQHLGRKLYGDENVHHINGDRGDNRIENLELWSTMQPSGQRVMDKIAFAVEILNRYKENK